MSFGALIIYKREQNELSVPTSKQTRLKTGRTASNLKRQCEQNRKCAPVYSNIVHSF